MRLEDYPPQQPLPDFAKSYHEQTWSLASDVQVIEVQYGADAYQSIAIAAPAKPNGAVMLFLHGGGWTCGYKEWNLFMAPLFTAAGIVFASAGYRLAPGSVFPAQLNDSADAVAWIHHNIGWYGGDPKKIFVGGHSAGGHLATLLTVRDDWRRERALPEGIICGCLPVSGVYDFGPGSGLARRPLFLGVQENADIDRAASPIRQLHPSLPPFFMAHGESDFPHLLVQAHAMAEGLRKNGIDLSELEFPGATHLDAHLATGDPGGAWFAIAHRFITNHQPQH